MIEGHVEPVARDVDPGRAAGGEVANGGGTQGFDGRCGIGNGDL
jgi:hypothetical protein